MNTQSIPLFAIIPLEGSIKNGDRDYMKKWSQRALSCLLMISLLMGNQTVCLRVLADEGKKANDLTTAGEDVFTRALTLQYKDQNNQDHLVNDGDTLPMEDIQSFEATYEFQLQDYEDEESLRRVHKADYYTIDLPIGITCTEITEEHSINDRDGNKIAGYQILHKEDHMQVIVTFSDYVEDQSVYDIQGQFQFSFELANLEIGAGENQDLTFPISPNASSTITIHKAEEQPALKPGSIQKRVKSYDEQQHTLTWEIEIIGEQNESAALAGCVLHDTLNPNLTFTSLTKNKEEVNVCQASSETSDAGYGGCYQYDSASNTIAYSFGDEEVTNPMVLTITTEIDEQLYTTKDQTTIENLATLTGGSLQDSILTSNIAEQSIDPKWISKDGSVIEGNRIQWNIKVNQAHQPMHDAVITDTLGNDLIMPESIELKKIKADNKIEASTVSLLPIDSSIPSDDSKLYAIMLDHHKFEVHFPRTSAYASNDSYEITYITDLKPFDDTQNNDTLPSYQNDASIKVTYGLGDGPYQPISIDITKDGIGVPKVIITDRTVASSSEKITGHKYTLAQEFKKYGIITWEMHTSSNLDNYQGATIENIIADNQRIYLNEQGKPELFWWNQNTKQWVDIFKETSQIQVLNDDPIPSATYTGNVITITYPKENCLKAQQRFRVRTIVNDYEQNMLQEQTFTNNANVAIYRTDAQGTSTIVSESKHDAKQAVDNVLLHKQAELISTTAPTVRYTIICNENNMPLSNARIVDDLKQIQTTFQISDGDTKDITIPWTYVAGSIQIQRITNGEAEDGISLDLVKQQAEAAYDETINELIFDFGSETLHNKYIISFEASLKSYQNDPLFSLNGTMQCFGNLAKLEAGNIINNAISSAPTPNLQQPLQNEMLSKAGSYTTANGRQGHWIIHINQREALLQDIILEDYMSSDMVLDPASVILYEHVLNDQGEFLSEQELAQKATQVKVNMQSELMETGPHAGEYKVTFALPKDQTAYVLIYDTDIEDHVSTNTTLSNQIQLAGKDEAHGTTSSNTINVTTAAGGSATKRSSVTLTKLDNDTLLPLPNTQIGLYQKLQDDYVMWKAQWTNEQGIASFFGLKPNQAYYLKEMTPADGYANDHEGYVELQVGPDPQAYTFTWEDALIKQGDFTFYATKQLHGATLTDQQFTFGIYDETGTRLAKGTNDESGLITFEDVNELLRSQYFTSSHLFDPQEQIYEETIPIWIKEEYPSELPDGFTYDDTVYALQLKIINERGQTALTIQLLDLNGVLLSSDGELPKELLTFINQYKKQEPDIPTPDEPIPDTPEPDVPNPPVPDTEVPDPETPLPDVPDSEVPKPIVPPTPSIPDDLTPTPPNPEPVLPPSPIVPPLDVTPAPTDTTNTSTPHQKDISKNSIPTGDQTNTIVLVTLLCISFSTLWFIRKKHHQL